MYWVVTISYEICTGEYFFHAVYGFHMTPTPPWPHQDDRLSASPLRGYLGWHPLQSMVTSLRYGGRKADEKDAAIFDPV